MWKGRHLRWGGCLPPSRARGKARCWLLRNPSAVRRARRFWRIRQRLCDTLGADLLPRPGWRNWQTQQTQNLPALVVMGVRPPLPAPIYKSFSINILQGDAGKTRGRNVPIFQFSANLCTESFLFSALRDSTQVFVRRVSWSITDFPVPIVSEVSGPFGIVAK